MRLVLTATFVIASACAISGERAASPQPASVNMSAAAADANEWGDYVSCRGRKIDYSECRARGSDCQLEAEPVVRENRCVDNADHCEDPERGPVRCMCSCSPEYQRRKKAVDAEHERQSSDRIDPACRDVVVEVNGRKVVKECPPPPADPR